MRSLIRKEPKTTVLKLLGSVLSALLLVFLLKQQGWESILDSVRQVGIEFTGIALALVLLSRLAVGARWYVLLRGVRVPIKFSDSMRLTFAGLFASNFLPTTIGGDVVRLAGGLRIGMDQTKCAASLIVDRLIGMTGMLIPLPIGLAALTRSNSPIIGMNVFLLVGLAARAGGSRSIRGWVLRVGRQLIAALRQWTRSPQTLLLALGLSLVHMAGLFSGLWFIIHSMEETISIARIAGLWSLIYFITLLPISVNGLGLQELSLSYIFGEMGGLSMQSALSLALIIRALLLLASLPGTFFVPGLIDRSSAGIRLGQESLDSEANEPF